MRARARWVWLAFVVGCGGEITGDDGGLGMDASAQLDAGPAMIDAAPTIDDAGPDDAGPPDAGPDDAGPPDAGPPDAGHDAGPTGCAIDCSTLSDACHEGRCNPATGACEVSERPNGTTCDDGNPCTHTDVCTSGTCAGAPLDCSAMSDACNVGSCDSSGACARIPRMAGTTCDDGDACTTASACAVRDGTGICEGTAMVDCGALDDACHVGRCAGGSCMRVNRPNGTACSDGSLCTTGDVCTSGVCGGTAIDCSAMSDMCHLGVCSPATGACGRSNRPDGTSCNDGMACTTADRCTAGTCGGTAVDCSAMSDMCNVGTCLASGSCGRVAMPNGSACTADTNACTRDTCTSGACGAALVCRPPSDFMPFGSTTTTTTRGSTSGSTIAVDTCPVGSALVGVEAQLGAGVTYLGMLRGVCRSLSITGSGAGPFAFADEGPSVVLPSRGTAGSGPILSSVCPVGRIMVGFVGRSGGAIDQLAVRCAPLSITATPTEWTVSSGTVGTSGSLGGGGGSPFPATDCPANQVATSLRTYFTAHVNAMNLMCQPARLSYAPTYTAVASTPYHGGPGGTAFNDACATGSAVIGYDGTVTAAGYLSSIRAACARLEVVGPVATPAIVQRNFSAPTLTPSRGTAGPSTFSLRCAAGEVVAGFSGREGAYVDQLVVRCAPLTVTSGGAISRGTPMSRGTAGGSGGTAFGATDCATGAFTSRNLGRAGGFLDAFAMTCTTATW